MSNHYCYGLILSEFHLFEPNKYLNMISCCKVWIGRPLLRPVRSLSQGPPSHPLPPIHLPPSHPPSLSHVFTILYTYFNNSIYIKIKNTIHNHSFFRQNCVWKLPTTVEPLTNDHPHHRPSLSYDHISCDGQWFLFVYESLTSDHPSYTTTPM